MFNGLSCTRHEAMGFSNTLRRHLQSERASGRWRPGLLLDWRLSHLRLEAFAWIIGKCIVSIQGQEIG